MTSYSLSTIKKIISWIERFKPDYLFVDYNVGSSPTVIGSVADFIRAHARQAVGYSEGNLTLKGVPTNNYYGHFDVGNNARNLGAFSYQGPASSPEEADIIWTDKLCRVIPTLVSNIDRRLANNPTMFPFILLNLCDLYTQAPLAVTEPNGLVDQLINVKPSLEKLENSVDFMVELRVNSYYDPTGKLCAAGFNNDVNKLTKDQRRRCNCLMEYVKTYLS